jgi:hypothetical protein
MLLESGEFPRHSAISSGAALELKTMHTHTLDRVRLETDQLRNLGTLLAAISRKASARIGLDPVALELAELAERAEELVASMVRGRAN